MQQPALAALTFPLTPPVLLKLCSHSLEHRGINDWRNWNLDPFFAWQLWSHKLLRYASPYCWVVALMACVTLVGDPWYRLALAAHLALIAEGIAGFLLEGRSQQVGLLRKPYYFLLTNVASLIATVRYVMGERVVTWNPTR